jgi:ABC-type uncharacterized transport system substrate-binding protein
LRETGHTEGQNVRIEYRWAEGQYDRLPAFAANFVHHSVDVIVAGGGIPSARWQQRMRPLPFPSSFFLDTDPVRDGLVARGHAYSA